MKKLLLLFAVMLSTVGAWAQMYQKVPHTKWSVSAFNEAAVSGNEGGVAFLKDENAETFYHSNWSGGYEDGTSGKNKGQDGVQGFLICLPENYTFDRITYKGRSNGENNWATKVRIYVYDELPEGLPKNLSTLTYAQKEGLFNKDSGTLSANPTFENSSSPWVNDQKIKTIDFDTPLSGKYVLFIADATTGTNGYLCCSDLSLWQKLDGIVEDKPYYLKIKGLDNYYLDTRVGEASDYGNTICKTQTPVPTYFTLNDGYWHISSLPGNEFKFINITQWDAIPASIEPANWTLHEVEEGLWSLAQSIYYGGGDSQKHYLGANDGNILGESKFYTDKLISQAVKFELVELTEEERAVEEVRAAEGRVNAAREIAQQVLDKIGVGYPAPGSEARATLQAAIDNEEATVESFYSAIDAYNAVTDVVLPEAGKVYRLTSAYSAFTSEKALYSDNTQLKWGDKNTSAMNQLWVVQNISGNNLTLMNVGDAMYPQVSGFTAQVRMLHVKNESSLNALGAGKFRVMANKQQSMFPDNHGNGAGSGGTISNANYEQAQWYFEEVAISKEILTAQVNSIKTAYVGSLLLKEEGVSNLQNATEVAEAVCNTDNGDYTTAFAQLIEAVNNATIDYIDLGYFYMKSKEGSKYAYNDGNNLKAADAKTCKSIFKLTKANNGTFYVQNGNGYYAQNVAQSAQTVIGSSSVEYTISRLSTNHYVLRPKNSTGQYQYWHQDGSNKIVGWETAGGNTQWTFESLSEEEVEKIYTVNLATCDASHYLSYTGEYAGDKDVKANGGFYVLDAVPTETDLNVQNLGDYASTVNIDAIQRNIKVVTGVDNSSIYILRCLKDNTYARYHSGCQLSANDKTNMMTWQGGMVMESLFYIEEGTDEYAGFYTIRSYAAPTMYAYNLGTANANSKVAMKEAPAEGGLTSAYYWKITYRDENGRPANITPYHEGGNTGDNFGWNKRGAYDGKNHIGYWNDDASCNATNDNKWYVRTVEEELTAWGKLPLQYTSDNSVIGLATYESVEPVIGFEELINQTGLNAINNVSYKVVGPKVGSFIRLKNEKSSKYMYGNKTTIKITDDAKANELPSTIFYLDKSNTLLSYVDGRYLDCEEKGYSAVGTANAGEFNFAYGGAKENVVVYKNHGVYTFGGATSGVGPDNIDKGSGYNENGYNWIVEGVASLPVTITAAGYATFYSPVAVSLPEGLEAYYVGETTNNSAKMTLIEGVIPANTGVILKGNEGAYDLTIGGEAVAVEDNKLSGTAAATYITEDAYVLSMVNKVVGFNKATKNQQDGTSWLNNGFKAYLPANAVTTAESRFLVFDFGGTETAIEGIEAENTADAVVYDLAGRRVQNAQKGVFIVNGKVVVK
mgnify:CR=1 FL=1